MRTIAIGLLGIVLVQGSAAAQTPAEQGLVIRDCYWSIADYNEHRLCLDPAHASGAAPAPRISTLPVAMVFRQLEYRLIGRDLVLRDVEADLIVAVLRDAIGGISTLRR